MRLSVLLSPQSSYLLGHLDLFPSVYAVVIPPTQNCIEPFDFIVIVNSLLLPLPHKPPDLGFAKAEVVADLMDQSTPDLAYNLFPAPADRFDRPLKESDFVRKNQAIPGGSFIDRHPLI